MLLAELNVRHTRRHMPTRRVAVDDGYLPTGGSAFGGVLIGAVVAEHIGGLDEEQFDALNRVVRDARNGLSVPRIALRYRLQTDTHGLDLSRHRIMTADVAASAFGHAAGGSLLPVLELDRHGPAAPQVIGAVMAAAWLGPTSRKVALRFVEAAIGRPGVMPEGLEVRRLFEGRPGLRPPLPGTPRTGTARTGTAMTDEWRGVPSERRWAMEVLGLHGGMAIERNDIQRRFRRLVRMAHPDHGAGSSGAAERIAELSEAREALLTVIASVEAQPAG